MCIMLRTSCNICSFGYVIDMNVFKKYCVTFG